MRFVKFSPEAAVDGLVVFFVAIVFKLFAKSHRKINGAGARPAVGLAIAGDQRIVFDAHESPHIFSFIIINAMPQVEDDVCLVGFRESVAIESHPRGGGKLSLHLIVVEQNTVKCRFCYFVQVRKPASVARLRIGFGAGTELQRAHGRHHQQVAQVGMTRTTEMRVAEADDGGIVVLVAGAIFVNAAVVLAVIVVLNGVSIGTELHRAKRDGRTRKGVPHALCARHRIYVLNEILRR